jgi:hypothetical protein
VLTNTAITGCLQQLHDALSTRASAPSNTGKARRLPMAAPVVRVWLCRCKAEPNTVLTTELGEFSVDNRCWMRTAFSLTQVRRCALHGGRDVLPPFVSAEPDHRQSQPAAARLVATA